MAWTYNPNDYSEQDFAPIPAGDHRVRINEVISKRFNSGNEGFEITLDVSGYGSKLWFYLVFDPNDTKKTNQRIGSFFDSFGITDYNMANFPRWRGKIGAVRVKHEEFNGDQKAKVAFCLAKRNQDKLPAWKETNPGATASAAPAVNSYAPAVDADDELPFA